MPKFPVVEQEVIEGDPGPAEQPSFVDSLDPAVRELLQTAAPERRWFRVVGSTFHKTRTLEEYVLLIEGVVAQHLWFFPSKNNTVVEVPGDLSLLGRGLPTFMLAYHNLRAVAGKSVPQFVLNYVSPPPPPNGDVPF